MPGSGGRGTRRPPRRPAPDESADCGARGGRGGRRRTSGGGRGGSGEEEGGREGASTRGRARLGRHHSWAPRTIAAASPSARRAAAAPTRAPDSNPATSHTCSTSASSKSTPSNDAMTGTAAGSGLTPAGGEGGAASTFAVGAAAAGARFSSTDAIVLEERRRPKGRAARRSNRVEGEGEWRRRHARATTVPTHRYGRARRPRRHAGRGRPPSGARQAGRVAALAPGTSRHRAGGRHARLRPRPGALVRHSRRRWVGRCGRRSGRQRGAIPAPLAPAARPPRRRPL